MQTSAGFTDAAPGWVARQSNKPKTFCPVCEKVKYFESNEFPSKRLTNVLEEPCQLLPEGSPGVLTLKQP